MSKAFFRSIKIPQEYKRLSIFQHSYIFPCIELIMPSFACWVECFFTESIHLIPKWRPINYSFLCMLITPLCLIFSTKFFCFLHMLTRRRGLINMQTKESFIGRHFGIRCILPCIENIIMLIVRKHARLYQLFKSSI